MEMRGKVTSALAWAGLVIVVGVPTIDLLLGRLAGHGEQAGAVAPSRPATAVAVPANEAAAVAAPKPMVVIAKPGLPSVAVVPPAAVAKPVPQSEAKAVAVASAPSAPATGPSTEGDAAVSTDPVKDYLASGKALPSYVKPVAAAAPAAAPAANTAPVTPAASKLATQLSSPAPAAAPQAVAQAAPKPAAKPRVVTEADLKDWKTGTLEDYLRSHGLLTVADSASSNSN